MISDNFGALTGYFHPLGTHMGASLKITSGHVGAAPRVCPRTSTRNSSNETTSKHGNLRPPRRRPKPYCTRSTPHHTYSNLLKDQNNITQAHQVWCSDLTRLVYRGTGWYLATIEDVATRQVVSKQIGKRHDSQLVFATLTQALATGHTPQFFHSDQGNEFMARRCTDYLEQRGVQISVSDVASPWQNGYIESFYARLKHELGDLDRFETPGEMIEAV